jgi:hypothetical protein
VAFNAGGSAIATATYGSTYARYNLISSIVGNNVPDDASGYMTADHSLIESPNGHSITDGDVDGNIVGHDPVLWVLGNYGGPTQTHAIKDGSPVISVGDNPQSLLTDQRGANFYRQVGDGVEMGAVEYGNNDTTPDPFSFAGQAGVALGVVRSSNVITVSGINRPAPISITSCTGTGCEYSVRGGVFTATPATVLNGDTVQVRQTSSALYNTTTDLALNIGGVTGVFAVTTIISYTVSADADGTGSGSITSDMGSIDYSYPATSSATSTPLSAGSNMTLTATTDTGSTVSWTDCGSTGGSATVATCTFSGLDENKSATANFTLNSYTVDILPPPVSEGSISPVSQIVDHGSAANFSVDAEPEYTIVSVDGCGGTWTGANPYITGPITEDCAIQASFTLNSYMIDTITVVEQGSISPPFRNGVIHGDTAEFDITAEPGYQIDTVTGCGGTWGDSNPYATGIITENCTVEATFEKSDCGFYVIPVKNGSLVVICL